MMLRLVNSRIIQTIVLCFALSVLTACSRDKVNEPTELEEGFKDKIHMKRLWKTSVGVGDDGLSLQLTPALVDDFIYSLDVEGELNVVSRLDGKKVWSKALAERISGGLGYDQKHLYYATFQGDIVCIDRHDGHEIWRQSLTSEALASPVSNGQIVVVQTIDGKLFSYSVADGILRWRYDSIGPILSLRGTSTPLVSQKYTIAGFANGELLAFDNKTGTPYWKATLGLPQGRTELERLVDTDGKAKIDGDKLYAIAYQGKLVSLSATTGKDIWSKDMSSYNGVALGFGQVYVTTADGDVVALKQSNGSEVWRNEKLKYRRLGSPAVFGQTLLTSDLEGYIHVLSLQNGEILARKAPDDEGIMGDILISGDQIYVYARSGDIVAYKLYSTDDMLTKTSSELKNY